ncbi:MAG: tRNA-dependent cyclodipeptide synthase [Sphingobium sp.]|nr:MAG: tRNA-dependent cyclodipeptide synthase [Sphingobium sp.]
MNLYSDILDRPSSTPLAKYRAKIAFVSPPGRRDSFEQEARCFVGVSLENRNFEPARFYAQLEWAARRFSDVQILVGDGIHRISVETVHGLSPRQAEERALELGRSFMRDNAHLLASFQDMAQINYLTCSAIQDIPSYSAFLSKLWGYFDRVPSFRQSVEAFAAHYHRKNWDQLSERDRAYRLKRSCEYFLEEFAIFACLVERGNSVMVYPGSFSTLAEIANGDFPGIPPELEALTVVSLQLKKR